MTGSAAERKTMHRLFWVWDFEKEEAWLNEMAMNGWALVRVGFCTFTFERCEPGEYIVRLEMHQSDPGYMDLMAETGAEYIGRVFGWIYFRRRSEYGSFDVFSDIDSRIAHLDKMGKSLLLIGIANLLIGTANSINGTIVGWINLLMATLLMYGLGRIHGKKEALEKERLLHE